MGGRVDLEPVELSRRRPRARAYAGASVSTGPGRGRGSCPLYGRLMALRAHTSIVSSRDGAEGDSACRDKDRYKILDCAWVNQRC